MLCCDELTKLLIKLPHLNDGFMPALRPKAASDPLSRSRTLTGCSSAVELLSHSQAAVSERERLEITLTWMKNVDFSCLPLLCALPSLFFLFSSL